MIETDALDPQTVFPPTTGCHTCTRLRAEVKAATRGRDTGELAARQRDLDTHVRGKHSGRAG